MSLSKRDRLDFEDNRVEGENEVKRRKEEKQLPLEQNDQPIDKKDDSEKSHISIDAVSAMERISRFLVIRQFFI